MNKIFKVVWSKTKECYVVVSEVAKNNGGKKKVLATVFAALVATGSMLPDYVDAANNTSGGGVSGADASIAIGSGWGNSAYANTNFSIAIGDQSNATGEAAIALGRKAKTNGEQASIAIGNQTEAIAKDSTAVGSGSKSSGEYAAALGFQTKATANYATAIGSGARGYAEDSQAIGREAETSAGATRAIAIGTLSKSSGNYATSLGSSAEATAERAIAVGYKSKAEAERAISVGNLANADHTDSIAVGNGSAATGDQAIATGSNATATKIGSIAMGKNVAASGDYSTAIGNKAKASGANSIAFGSSIDNTTTGTVASGDNSIAIGMKSTASGDGAVAHGVGSESTGKHSVAVGRLSKAKGDESLALGDEAEATVNNSVAVGYKANATIVNGVALGSESKTTVDAGQVGYNPAAGRTNKYDNLTNNTDNVLTSNRAAIAIGDDDAHITRQLTGLAAGTKDTDAVNVAQLRAVNLKYAGNSGNSDVRLENGTLNIKGEGLLSTSADATGITVKLTKGDDIAKDNGKAKEPTNNGVATTQNVVQAINNSYWKATAGGNTDGTPAVGNVKPGTQVTYSAGDNLKVKQTIAANGDQEYKYSLNPVLTGITSIANTTTGPKMTFGGSSINITGGSLDMGTNKITNLAPGTADNDAVNVKQLKDTELHITPGTYTPDANKKVKLTYTDGNSTVVTGKEAVIDLSGLATGGTTSTEKVQKAADAAGDKNIAEVGPKSGDTFGAANATYEVSVSRNAVKDAAREAVTVNNGGTTTGGTYTADTNNPISVTAVPDSTNHNTTYAVTFDGNKAAKQIPLTYKATNGTITTADQTVKLDKGLNFTGGDYTTASVGADGKVTFDVTLGTTPTVTDGKPGVPGQAGAAGKDGIATVKTVVDTINNSGWKANAKANGGKLDGNSTATVVKPGDQVNFAAGKNLTVKQDLTGEHTYTYSLNKDLKDLTSVEIGGSTIKTDGDHITITSPDTNPGATPGATVTNKVANLGDEKHIKPDTYAVANDGSVTLKYVDGNGKDLTETTKITGIAKKAKVINGKNTTVEEGTDAVDNSTTYKVNVKGDLTGISSITNDGTNNGKISFGPNKTVTVDGDHSITLNASTGKIGGLQNLTFDPTNFTSGQAATEDQLKSVHDTLKANERHIAPTTVATGSTENKGGTTVGTENIYKYDATTKKVTLTYNDGNGHSVTDTKAVIDFSALNTGGTTASTWTAKTSAENTTAGSEVGKHAGDTSQVIGDQNSVDFQAGKNMTVKQTNDGNGNTTINYALDKNLDVESVHVGKDGKDGKIGIDGKDGVDGLDGTNRVDIHVEKGAKGVDGTDGHDGVNGHNGKDGMTRIVYEDKGGKQEVATLNDGLKYAGDDAQGTDKTKVIAKKLNETLDIIGGANKADLTTDNIGVNNDGNGKLLVQLSKKLKGLDSVQTKTVELGDHTTSGGTTNITYNAGDKRIEYTTPGATPGTTDTKKVATTDDIWTIQGNGTDVAPVNGKVNVKAGENILITTPTTADGSMTINAVTPAVYTDKNGNKLTKDKDGKFHKPDGTEVAPADVITSIQDAAGNVTGGNSIVNNVGSAIKNAGNAGDSFLTKLDAANTATPNAAVNVSDLKNTADGLTDKGLKFDANEGGIKTNKLGSTVTVQGSGALTAGKAYADEYNTANIRTNISQNNGDTVINVGLAKALKDINSISNGASSITLNSTPGGATNTPAVQITGGNLSMGDGTTNNKIVNLAPGTADTDAVNVKQLKDTELHITPGTYTPGADKKVKLTYTDGNNTVVNGKEAVIDLSGLATGGTTSTEKVQKAADAAGDKNIAEVGPKSGDTFGAANATYEVSVSRNAVKDAAREAVTVNNGGTTTGGTYTADTNNPISVTAVPDSTNHNTTYAVTFDGNKAAKQIPLTYKATNGTITTADQTVKLDKGLNFTGGDYTTASVGADGKVTFDVTLGTTPTVTDGKPGVPGQAGAAGKDGIATVKTVVDTINNSGWKANAKANGGKLDGNSTATVVKPGDQVNFAAGKNLTVKQDLTGEHTYTYSLNKDLKDLTSVEIGGSTIKTDGDHITITSPDTNPGATPGATVTNKVANLGDEKHIKPDTYAVANDGSVTLKYVDGNGKDLTETTKITGIAKKAKVINGKNTTVEEGTDAVDNSTTYKVNVKGDLTGISSITNDGTNNGKISFGPNKTVTVDGDHSITLNASTGKIGGLQNLTFDPTNFTSGQAATEDQLKSVHDTLKANERHIAPTTVATGSTENKGGTTVGTENIYKYDATTKKVTLTYNDGNGHSVTDTKAVIDFSALNTGGTTASTWTAKTSAENTTAGSEVGKHAGDTSQVIGDQNSVDFQAGKNMTVKQTNDGNGNTTINYALDKNLDVESVHVGKDGKDGKIGIDGKDGVDGLDGTNRVDIHVEKGAKGVDGTDGHDGVNGHNGKDGMTRIVYEDKGGKQEVATLNDGLKYAGDDAQGTDKTKVIAKKLNETLDIIGGANKADLTTDNIGVNNDGNGKLLVQLSKKLKGLDSVQTKTVELGDHTTSGGTTNITYNAGDKRIEYTTPGATPGTTDTKKVATTDDIWTIQAGGVDVPAKSGKVNLVAGDHITITPDAANGKMTISATGFGTMNGFDVTANNGATSKTIDNGKKVDFNAGSNLTVKQTNDADGTHIEYALNKDVDLGTNGSLKTGDTTIDNNGLKNGNTTVGGNGMTIKDPTDPAKTVSLTKDGLNNGGNQITNVASGGNVDTNAANIGDIKRLAKDTRIKDGTYTVDTNGTVELTYVDGAGNQVKDASGNAITAKITGITTLDSTRVNVAVDKTGSGKVVGATTPVKVTKGTEFIAGDNLIVERKARTGNDLDNSVVYSLNSNLTGINSISNTSTGPKMTFGGNSINVTDGNLNMGDNKITNVKKGTAPTDAANVGQLTKVTSNNHSVVINKTTDANGAPVYDLAVTGTPGAPAADPRVDMLGEEIGRVGAQGAALSALKPIQYDPLEPTQIMAGYGNYRGNSAVALGVAHYKNESTLIHGGVSWAGGSSHMMANAGVTWKVGNRDSEAAVADRYRKGPISSAYAMQQEMAAMKAQNAGLKGEVSDLKAENEQMKAQIAAMMAKLGL